MSCDNDSYNAFYSKLAISKKPDFILPIPAHVAGGIIGKNGMQIKKFNDAFEQEYSLQRSPVWISDFGVDGEKLTESRHLCLRGGRHVVKQMLERIHHFITSESCEVDMTGLKTFNELKEKKTSTKAPMRRPTCITSSQLGVISCPRDVSKIVSPASSTSSTSTITHDHSFFAFDFMQPQSQPPSPSSSGDMASFLTSIGLLDLNERFQAASVDIMALRLMKKEHYDEINIPLGYRIRIQSALANM
jgi:hypothetical protein